MTRAVDAPPDASVPRGLELWAALVAVGVQAGLVAGGAWSGTPATPVHASADTGLGPLGALLLRMDGGLAPTLLVLRRLLVHGLLVVVAARALCPRWTLGSSTVLAAALGALPLFVTQIAGPYGDAPVVATTLALCAWALLRGRVAEDVRVAPDELVADARDRVGGREPVAVGGELAEEDDLHQQVAELLAERARITRVDGLDELEGLLDDEATHRLGGLRAIPGAAPRPEEPAHDFHQFREALAVHVRVT